MTDENYNGRLTQSNVPQADINISRYSFQSLFFFPY